MGDIRIDATQPGRLYITDAKTGDPINGVSGVEWEMKCGEHDGLSQGILTIHHVPIILECRRPDDDGERKIRFTAYCENCRVPARNKRDMPPLLEYRGFSRLEGGDAHLIFRCPACEEVLTADLPMTVD